MKIFDDYVGIQIRNIQRVKDIWKGAMEYYLI